jgi:hypothetical protein
MGKFAVVDLPFCALPLFLAVLVPRELKLGLTVVLEE